MEITGKTTLTGLIGGPVAHSISPQMHNESFRQLGLDYVYLAFDLAGSDLGNRSTRSQRYRCKRLQRNYAVQSTRVRIHG